MEAYRICLFGHRDFAGHQILDTRLFELIKNVIDTKNFVEIYIGRNGELDIYAASVIKRAQRYVGKHNSELICILPYYNKDIEYYSKYYDSVMIPESIEKLHPKRVITERNRWMIEMCEVVVCYVEKQSGGAYDAMQYACRLGKKVINLAKQT